MFRGGCGAVLDMSYACSDGVLSLRPVRSVVVAGKGLLPWHHKGDAGERAGAWAEGAGRGRKQRRKAPSCRPAEQQAQATSTAAAATKAAPNHAIDPSSATPRRHGHTTTKTHAHRNT